MTIALIALALILLVLGLALLKVVRYFKMLSQWNYAEW